MDKNIIEDLCAKMSAAWDMMDEANEKLSTLDQYTDEYEAVQKEYMKWSCVVEELDSRIENEGK